MIVLARKTCDSCTHAGHIVPYKYYKVVQMTIFVNEPNLIHWKIYKPNYHWRAYLTVYTSVLKYVWFNLKKEITCSPFLNKHPGSRS